MNRTYICIDLKSFYASVECVERGLDPFQTDLVVADPDRSKSTICLAITPAMKEKGIKNRCRIHEIPPGMSYITAMPRMQLYIDYAARIYAVYLKYISAEDIHLYSIDECFIDVTDYLPLYHLSEKEMAQTLIDEVMAETGITASAGIGTNLYLAKIAMDIIAKKSKDHIGFLNEELFRKKLWNYRPLTDFWRIGGGTARRLAKNGMFTMGDIARTSVDAEDLLFRLFGIDAELLIDHAWGYESCRMQDIKNYHSKMKSLSNGQVLMRNYSFSEALIIIKEMADNLSLDLCRENLTTTSITIVISYDHRFAVPGSTGTVDLGLSTNSSKQIIEAAELLYRGIADRNTGIRRLMICANKVIPDWYLQFDLFSDPVRREKEKKLQRTLLEIKDRYGKNAVMRGINLLTCSTYRERNRQIGGHWA